MAANFPLELPTRRYETSIPAETQAGSRHFNSFIVRLWKDDESDAMLRVELQHVQAGLSIEAMEVPLDWILPEIMGCMQSSDSTTGVEDSDSDRPLQ